MEQGKAKIVNIVFYSGTGGTERVSKCFKKEFEEVGYRVYLQHLTAGAIYDE